MNAVILQTWILTFDSVPNRTVSPFFSATALPSTQLAYYLAKQAANSTVAFATGKS